MKIFLICILIQSAWCFPSQSGSSSASGEFQRGSTPATIRSKSFFDVEGVPKLSANKPNLPTWAVTTFLGLQGFAWPFNNVIASSSPQPQIQQQQQKIYQTETATIPIEQLIYDAVTINNIDEVSQQQQQIFPTETATGTIEPILAAAVTTNAVDEEAQQEQQQLFTATVQPLNSWISGATPSLDETSNLVPLNDGQTHIFDAFTFTPISTAIADDVMGAWGIPSSTITYGDVEWTGNQETPGAPLIPELWNLLVSKMPTVVGDDDQGGAAVTQNSVNNQLYIESSTNAAIKY